MDALERRVDLRFGGFACSVRGFDDPVGPLTRILEAMHTTLADRAPEAGGPLFDEATMRRLEAEIASVCNGGTVAAMPGLVLTMGEAGEARSDASAIEHALRDDDAPAEQDATADVLPEEAFRDAFLAADDAGPEDAAGAEDGPNLFEEPDGDAPDARRPNLFAAEGEDGFAEPDRSIFAGLEPAAETDPETAVAEAEPAIETPEADASANLFDAPPGEDDLAEPDRNLFGDDEPDGNLFAEEEPATAADSGEYRLDDAAPAHEAEDENEDVVPISNFRDLGQFDGTPPEPAAELPPPRPAAGISAADLARKAGATAPVDLIAASAAWLAVVRGHHTFTRREVLEIFEELPGEHPKTPEAKVKGFGRLVRNGQITLGNDDRFRLSDAERDRFEDLLG